MIEEIETDSQDEVENLAGNSRYNQTLFDNINFLGLRVILEVGKPIAPSKTPKKHNNGLKHCNRFEMT